MLPARLNREIIEAGCDEAGRGCLAGPVFAAAVILPVDYQHIDLDDSKKLSKKQRLELRAEIESVAMAHSVAFCTPKTIDRINILNASFEAMHKAVARLEIIPEKLLIDGNRFNPYRDFEFECIVKGDGKIGSIAAASILAKTYRDEYMERKHVKFPYYAWDTNKGYPTEAHRKAIIEHGPCGLHRRSFQLYPLPEQIKLFS